MSIKLVPKPCPVCQSKAVGVIFIDPYENIRAVVCEDCGHTGEWANQHHDAISAWNNGE